MCILSFSLDLINKPPSTHATIYHGKSHISSLMHNPQCLINYIYWVGCWLLCCVVIALLLAYARVTWSSSLKTNENAVVVNLMSLRHAQYGSRLNLTAPPSPPNHHLLHTRPDVSFIRVDAHTHSHTYHHRTISHNRHILYIVVVYSRYNQHEICNLESCCAKSHTHHKCTKGQKRTTYIHINIWQPQSCVSNGY